MTALVTSSGARSTVRSGMSGETNVSARRGQTIYSRPIYGTSVENVNFERSHSLISQQKTEVEKQAYYKEQAKLARANIAKIEGEAKVLIAQSKEALSHGHLYKAGTALACVGCIAGLMGLSVWGYKIVKELR